MYKGAASGRSSFWVEEPPMGEAQTLLLGFIAGGTIVLGLPIGRLRTPAVGTRVFLNATAVGVLVFLAWDVLTQAWEPIDSTLKALREGSGGPAPVIGYAALFLGGIGVGLCSLAAYESWMSRHRPPGAPAPGPGAMTATEPVRAPWSPARRLVLLIAIGIGLHNFGEGLAIGGSAAKGEIALATLLVIGFALHNATEGFGIVAPLASEGERPGWGFLLLMGLVGGGPTFLGTAVGRAFTSDPLSVVFLALAAGSILYVVVQLIGVGLRAQRNAALYAGVLAGLAAGFITDMIVTAGGA
jgi:ZIP family zinc transporter